MNIGTVDLDQDILIIAEIGNNHEGDFALAQKMIRAAAKAGAGAVKFQTIIPDKLVSAQQKDALDQFTKFQFNYDQFAQLKEVADSEGVMFLSTPFDVESAQFLDTLVPAFKIASGDNNYFPLIEAVAKKGKPILMSTGMADLATIEQSKQLMEKVWRQENIEPQLVILHCVSLYPTPLREANLLTIPFLKEKLKTTVGYSDHTVGLEAPVMAVGLGARVIEKHFTLDKHFSDFPDHRISMDPEDLTQLVEKISQTVDMLGSYGISVGKDELEIAKIARRSVVARADLPAGNRMQWKDLDWVRPGGGIPPGEEDKILGKTLKRALSKGSPISVDDLE